MALGPVGPAWPATGVIVAEDDLVIVRGRNSGHGRPKNWIAADIFRVADELLVEHWDVLQDEATEEESKSKAPMFGASFPRYPGLKEAGLSRSGKTDRS